MMVVTGITQQNKTITDKNKTTIYKEVILTAWVIQKRVFGWQVRVEL